MNAGPKTLAALKMLATGKGVPYVTSATGMGSEQVLAIARAHGYPDMAKLAAAAEELTAQLTARDALPTRQPVPSRPSPPAALNSRPALPAAGGTNGSPRGVASSPRGENAATPPAPTIDELVRACRRSEHKRTQALGPKLTELADKITTALRTERETAEAKAKQSEAFTAKKAAVDRLAKQLAAAKAELQRLKPSGGTEAAPLEHACTECGALFTTSQGRSLHARRTHGPALTTATTPVDTPEQQRTPA